MAVVDACGPKLVDRCLCKPMQKSTEGIVLKTNVFGEADLIVTYLTRDYGLLKAFAKSPRKIRSRFGSSLEPLTHAKISFIGKEDTNLPRLTQSDIMRSFHSLREDLCCFLRVAEMLELNLHFLPEREPGAPLFDLLLDSMSILESNRENPVCFVHYKMKFLEMTGYSPKVDGCARCSRPASRNGRHTFYVSHGAILCRNCIEDPTDAITVSDATVRLYRSLLQWHPGKICRIHAPDHLLSEVRTVIDSHINFILARPMKSLSGIENGSSKTRTGLSEVRFNERSAGQ